MKSLKPGRKPSQINAVGSIIVAVFGVLWCIMAGVMGIWFVLPFGLFFIGFSIYNAFYHIHNAMSEAEDRDSIVDIVDSETKQDIHKSATNESIKMRSECRKIFCPYCGNSVDDTFLFCPKCGKVLHD